MFKFDLHEGEKLYKLLRQSEITLAGPVLAVMLLIYLPSAFLLKYDLFYEYRWFMLLWTIVLLVYFANKYVTWLLNCYLITSKRVVLVTHRNVFAKDVTEAPVSELLNVKFVTHGFWSILSLGDVEIRASGLEEPLILKNQSRPGQLKDFLWKLMEKKHEQTAASHASPVTVAHTPVNKPVRTNKI